MFHFYSNIASPRNCPRNRKERKRSKEETEEKRTKEKKREMSGILSIL